MQRKLTFQRLSEDEEIKSAGLFLDFDEIARKGVMSAEEKNIAKWYGVYTSRQPGNCMVRIVIPGGVITSSQARTIALVSEKYAQGRMNITTRQSIQYHWLKTKNLAHMMRELAADNLSTFHGCGDVTRNVAACPMAEICQYKRFDVMPFARESAATLTDARDLDNLPRKFKITWSGCEGNCAQPHMNCLGMIGVEKDGKTGFKAVIGGGMGWKAFVAPDLFSFIPKEKAVAVTRAVALLFRDHGDRFNRAKSRLKFVVDRYGVDICRQMVMEYLENEGVATNGIETEPFKDTGGPIPERPITDANFMGTDNLGVVRVRIPKGEMNFKQLLKVAELSEIYANQRIYTTNRQNLELHGIDPQDLDRVKEEFKTLGYETNNFFGLNDIVACVGTTYCPKAVATTRDLYDNLEKVIKDHAYDKIRDKAIINITGCPNSCSPYRISDFGFRGMRIREEMGSVEGYEMLLGGWEDHYGLKFGEFKATDCPEVVKIILDKFMTIRENDESLSGCVKRLGLDPFKEAVYGK